MDDRLLIRRNLRTRHDVRHPQLHCLLLALLAPGPAMADCIAIQKSADAAVKARDPDLLEQLRVEARLHCPATNAEMIGLQASLVLWNALRAEGITIESPQLSSRVARIDRNGGYWQASAMLAEHHRRGRRWGDAYDAYSNALRLVEDRLRTPQPPQASELRTLVEGRDVALALAVENGQRSTRGAFRATRSTLEVVGAERLPIPFEFGKDIPTPDGERLMDEAVGEIVRAAPPGVRLDGHTDDIGSDAFNFELSERRANRFRSVLEAAGYRGRVEVKAYGESRPFPRGDATAGLSEEEYRAVCRRVEYVMLD